MATWIRHSVATDADVDWTYVNLDHVRQIRVAATTGGPAGFVLILTGDNGDLPGSVYSRWDTAAQADEALRNIIGGVDLLDTKGEVG